MVLYGKVITMSKDKDMEEKDGKGAEETQQIGQPEEAKAPAAKARDKEKAKKDIERHLAKKSVWHTENEVSDTVDALYSACEADGSVPTREAFAAMCVNPELGEAVAGMGHDPFTEKPLNKKAIALAAVAVLAVACIGVAAVALQPQGGPLPVAGSSSSASSSESRDSGSTSSSKKDEGKTSSSEDKSESKDESKSEDKKVADSKDSSSSSKKEDKGASSSKPASSQQQAPATKPSGNSGGQVSSKPSQPSHTHTWVEQTTTQWVSNNVWVVDQAAWDEPIYTATWVCKCGASFGSEGAVIDHCTNMAFAGDNNHGYSVQEAITGYTHHDEVGHWEDQGYNQTVVTGYKCSGCGATK